MFNKNRKESTSGDAFGAQLMSKNMHHLNQGAGQIQPKQGNSKNNIS
jgi:hypothetical protein|tara:strand:- start:1056 stop:1196 length:141 start_codon:yes stop_codon:yes gene_type:complete